MILLVLEIKLTYKCPRPKKLKMLGYMYIWVYVFPKKSNFCDTVQTVHFLQLYSALYYGMVKDGLESYILLLFCIKN